MPARLPYLERDQVSPEIQAIFDVLLRASGRVLNFYRLIAHHAASMPAFVQWYPKLREGALDARLRELAYVKASQLNGCRYCATHHGTLGRRAGISREQFEALSGYATSPLFSELDRLVIRYAEDMTRTVQVDPALVESLKQHLSPEALVQLTLNIAAANFTNRVNEALGTELEA
jgi:uncharacterized peroxidase-related enzyme